MDLNERSKLQSGDEEADCSFKTKLERRLVVALFIVVIVGLGLCIGLIGDSRSKANKVSNVCLSPQCISTASHLLHSMDFDQQPCEDFYSFVCGNWAKNNYLVGEVTTQFTKLNNLIAEKVKDILDTSNQNASEHEIKTKQFYDACMDMTTRNKNGVKFLYDDLKSFGGWPLIDEEWKDSTFNWSNLMIKFHQNGYPANMIFDISVDMDIKNTSTTLIIIDQPLFVLDDRRHYLIPNDSSVKRLKSFLLEAALTLNPNLNRKTATEDIGHAFDIEKRLAESINKKPSLRDPSDIYNIMTLVEIEEFAPKVPWRYLLKAFLSNDTELQSDQRIMVTDPNLIKALDEILTDLDNDKGKRALANYMLYTAVLFAAGHLQEDLFFLYESKLHRSQAISLWKVCYRTTVKFFHQSLTASYAQRYMDTAGMTMIETMFQEIKNSLLDNINEAKWLDRETRETAKLKIEKSRSAIAFPDEILDERNINDYYSSIQLTEDHFTNVKAAYGFKSKEKLNGLNSVRTRFSWYSMDNLLTANAFYEPTENAIVIPIGILQGIFFSPGRPNYMNYGSLGTILGHEYTHAFDNAGGLYDEDGNYKIWWTNQSWESFQAKEQCYIEQYNQYYEPHVESYVNGNLTLGENMADNGGVAAVYEAYTNLLGKIGKEEQLPGLNFSEGQMFWIAFASSWCRRQTASSIEYLMENSVHAPAKFRVNGVLSNIKEFSEDFQCKHGSPLNPSVKCFLWK